MTESLQSAVDYLLKSLSEQPLRSMCPACGSELRQLEFTFFPEGNEARTVSLAFCPRCDGEDDVARDTRPAIC